MTQREQIKICTCHHCGNESEMVFVCAPPHPEKDEYSYSSKRISAEAEPAVKGTAICSHCGNEAEMWLDQ